MSADQDAAAAAQHHDTPDTGATAPADPSSASATPDTPESPEPTDQREETVDAADCLVGNWYVDKAEFGKLMSTVSGSAVDDVTGVVMLTLKPGGTTVTHYDDWRHSITMDGARATIVKDGKDFGTYELTGAGAMTVSDTRISSTTKVTIGTSTTTIGSGQPASPSVFSRATFECSGDELRATVQGRTTTLHREH